jgi:hypothetical protein
MKSFELVVMMKRVDIPLRPHSINLNEKNDMRIDFIQNIFVVIGDDQTVLHGGSIHLHVITKFLIKNCQ